MFDWLDTQPPPYPTEMIPVRVAMKVYSKSFIPLESDLEMLTSLADSLGLSLRLAFHDVLSIEDQEALAYTPPGRCTRLFFALRARKSTPHEVAKQIEDARRIKHDDTPKRPAADERVVVLEQTIDACGLYGPLHAICNAADGHCIGTPSLHRFLTVAQQSHPTPVLTSGPIPAPPAPDSLIAQLLQRQTPSARRSFLETSEDIERHYGTAARQGQTAPPATAGDEIALHYAWFIKSHESGWLYGVRAGWMASGPGPWRTASSAALQVSRPRNALDPYGATVLQALCAGGGETERQRDGFSLLACWPWQQRAPKASSGRYD